MAESARKTELISANHWCLRVWRICGALWLMSIAVSFWRMTAALPEPPPDNAELIVRSCNVAIGLMSIFPLWIAVFPKKKPRKPPGVLGCVVAVILATPAVFVLPVYAFISFELMAISAMVWPWKERRWFFFYTVPEVEQSDEGPNEPDTQ